VVWSALALTLSYESACSAPAALAPETERTKAVLYRCYGGPEVLKVEATAKPVPADNEVLVRVRAAAVNPLDWHYMRGKPYLMRLSSGIGAPNDYKMGVDFAGTIEAVGKSVTRFKVGDEVFGGRNGAFAEYLLVREDRTIAIKPANFSFEEAAAVPVAAVTELQALRTNAQIKPGDTVLINGASGGAGTYAVQIAKALGAQVTGVCSTRNVAMVRSIGADRVIDHTQQNFTQDPEHFDVIIDNVGNHSLAALRRALRDDGTLVMVGGPDDGEYLGPLKRTLVALVASPFVSSKLAPMLSEFNAADFAYLTELMQSGKLRSVIDRRCTLNETAAAVACVEEGRARGKVIITID
jgi:NADPH:quinone reductase-like Zn-dependent oxidoreductase